LSISANHALNPNVDWDQLRPKLVTKKETDEITDGNVTWMWIALLLVACIASSTLACGCVYIIRKIRQQGKPKPFIVEVEAKQIENGRGSP